MKPKMQQRSRDWFIARLGCITGTRFKDAVGSISRRANLVKELNEEIELLKRINAGEPHEFEEIDNKNLEWGRKYEDVAISNYQLINWVDDIERPALVTHRQHKFIKVSPDFIERGSEGINEYTKFCEVKCPIDESIHLSYIHQNGIPDDHIYQVHGGAWVCQCGLSTFITYHPGSDQQLHTHTEEIDESVTGLIESACLDVWEHVQNKTVPKPVYNSIPNLFGG